LAKGTPGQRPETANLVDDAIYTAWSCSAMRVAAKKGCGEIKDSVEVIDVAQLLVRSVARKAASLNGADTDAD